MENKKVKIIAPNGEYTGISATVAFVKGVGETDDPHLAEWFNENGYEVEDIALENSEDDESDSDQNASEKDKGKGKGKTGKSEQSTEDENGGGESQ